MTIFLHRRCSTLGAIGRPRVSRPPKIGRLSSAYFLLQTMTPIVALKSHPLPPPGAYVMLEATEVLIQARHSELPEDIPKIFHFVAFQCELS